MKQPIAMRCTKKQFKAIKPKLKEIGTIGRLNGAFKEYKYLNNNYGPKENNFYFVNNTSLWQREHQNNIHEEWNEKIFLEACGIEVEKTFSITESQIKEFCKFNTANENVLKQFIPEAFESEVKELKIGTWYIYNKCLINYQGILENSSIIKGYGFTPHDWKWHEKESRWGSSPEEWTEATAEQVREVIDNEINKRYKVGDYLSNHQGTWQLKNINLIDRLFNNAISENIGIYNKQESGKWLLFDGKWAEVIEQITLSEAEQQLKKKIIV